jgi:hypothetical protein
MEAPAVTKPVPTPERAVAPVRPGRATRDIGGSATTLGPDDRLARSREWARIAATWQEARALLAEKPASFGTRDLMSALTRLSDALSDVGVLVDKGWLSADDAALLRLGFNVIGEAERDLPDPSSADEVVAQLRALVPDLQRLASQTNLRPEITRQVGAVINLRVGEAQRLMAGQAAARDKSLTDTVDTVRSLVTQLARSPAPASVSADAAAAEPVPQESLRPSARFGIE